MVPSTLAVTNKSSNNSSNKSYTITTMATNSDSEMIEALLEVGGAGTSDTVDNTPFVDRATEAIDRLISNISESESGYVLI